MVDERALRRAVAKKVGCKVGDIVTLRVLEEKPPVRREPEVVCIVADAPGAKAGPKYRFAMSELQVGGRGAGERRSRGAEEQEGGGEEGEAETVAAPPARVTVRSRRKGGGG